MCGIFLRISEKSLSQRQASEITKTLALRGPDDTRLVSRKISRKLYMDLAFSWLSISSDDPKGMQPYSCLSSNSVMLFNGEIYSLSEIIRKLPTRVLESIDLTSDTQVLGEFLAVYGFNRETLSILDGMFSIIWLDFENETLKIARDRFGTKPLFYNLKNASELIVASTYRPCLLSEELRASKGGLEVLRSLITGNSYDSIHEVLGVRRLDAGEMIEIGWSQNELKLKDKLLWYNRSEIYTEDSAGSKMLLEKRLLSALEATIPKNRDYVLSVSGGLDSALLYAGIKEFGLKRPVKTISCQYGIAPNHDNELKFLWDLVSQDQIECEVVDIALRDPMEMIEQAAEIHDDILPSSSMLAEIQLYETIRLTGCRVVLDGQGPDEMLLGYRYLREHYHHDLAHSQRALTFLLDKLFSKLLGYEGSSMDAEQFYKTSFKSIFDRSLQLSNTLDVSHLREQLVFEGSLQQNLNYGDRASMAYEVEARYPYLTSSLSAILRGFRISDLFGIVCDKRPLRLLGKKLGIPNSVLNRRKKSGFEGVPRSALLSKVDPGLLCKNETALHQFFSENGLKFDAKRCDPVRVLSAYKLLDRWGWL